MPRRPLCSHCGGELDTRGPFCLSCQPTTARLVLGPPGFDAAWSRSPILYAHVTLVLTLLAALLVARSSVAGGVVCVFALLVDGAIAPLAITAMASAAYVDARVQKVCGAFMVANGLLGFAGLVVAGAAAVDRASPWMAMLALLFVVYACVWARVGAALLARKHDELGDDDLLFEDDA